MPALRSVASSWLNTRNSRVEIRAAGAGSRGSDSPKAPARWIAENVEALFLEFAAQPRLVVGDVDAFNDFAARGAEPAAKFHEVTAPGWPDGRNTLSPWTLSADRSADYISGIAPEVTGLLEVRQENDAFG